jgi:hypothetical protein
MDKTHLLNCCHNPLASGFVTLELKCCERSDGRSFNRPECARLIIGAIDSIASAVPPSPGFAPTRENGMDTKTSPSKGEFDRSGWSIDKDLSCWDYFACHVCALLIANFDFQFRLPFRTDVRKIAHPTDKSNAKAPVEGFERLLGLQ